MIADLAALSASPALLIDCASTLGECPRWHAQEQRLYWVDIAARALHRWDSRTGRQDNRTFDAPVGCFAFRGGGGFVLGMQSGAALIDHWDDSPRPFGPQPLSGRPHHRMNDGRTDPVGRFWLGSLNAAKDIPDAALYRLDTDGTLTAVAKKMTTCNTAAFTFDGRRFAHSDTPSHQTSLYDCDPATGTLSNRRLLHAFPPGVGPGLGRPDGASFDMDGCLWIAMFDGWRVVRLSPTGALLADIRLPVQRPTMIAFGGPDGRTAFVTTATTGLDAAALADQPGAGGIFAFRVDTPGIAEWPFAG